MSGERGPSTSGSVFEQASASEGVSPEPGVQRGICGRLTAAMKYSVSVQFSLFAQCLRRKHSLMPGRHFVCPLCTMSYSLQ